MNDYTLTVITDDTRFRYECQAVEDAGALYALTYSEDYRAIPNGTSVEITITKTNAGVPV